MSCGGDGHDVGGSADPDEGTIFAEVIPAATGGTISTGQGWGTLIIPAGSLEKDAEVSLTPGPAQSGSVTSVYDVDPADTTFDPVASLSIVYDGEPGVGNIVVLALLANGIWEEVAGSSLSEGRLSGGISVGGRYAGVLRTSPGQLSIDCAKIWRDFSPCGGEIATTWRQVATCLEGAPFPLSAPTYCPDRAGTWGLAQLGVVTISESSESTFLNQDATSADFQAPLSCFPDGSSCSGITRMDEWFTSCQANKGGCHCSGLQRFPVSTSQPIPLRIDENDLVLLDADGIETGRKPFCVTGTVAVVEDTWTAAGGEPIRVLRVLNR
jgi:hypothetical protein